MVHMTAKSCVFLWKRRCRYSRLGDFLRNVQEGLPTLGGKETKVTGHATGTDKDWRYPLVN